MSDYAHDVTISEQTIEQTAEMARKWRATARFLLGCVDDLDPSDLHAPQVRDLDQYVQMRLHTLCKEITEAYERNHFSRVGALINQFSVSLLSSLYFDVCKDRLYASRANDPDRRACQAVMYHVLRVLTTAMAPLLPLTAEEIFEFVPPALKEHFGSGSVLPMPTTSIFRAAAGWHTMQMPEAWAAEADARAERWHSLLAVRAVVTRALERARQEGNIGSSLEAWVQLDVSEAAVAPTVASLPDDTWAELCIVSQMDVVKNVEAADALVMEVDSSPEFGGPVRVAVRRSTSAKCERCWKWTAPVEEEVCARCKAVLA